ncbi:hypothetical protein ACFWYW_57325 [Nonomuraea sp. NPDC059023]|uniref:hypothetical protein n=1 Tax=unclassified Nonomuraea TaxID=2593643 RepID=UPI003692B06D
MAWKLIPGASTTLPVAMAYARDGELLVFHVGTDQIVYLNRRPADTWLGWQKFPQPAQTKYAVAAANGPGGNVIVFHTGLDGKLYQSGQDGAHGWTPWELLDGGTGNTPQAIAVASDGRRMAWCHIGGSKNVYTDEITFMTAE